MTHEPLASPTPLHDARLRASMETVEVRPHEQRTDRLRLAHDQLYNDLGVLVDRLQPVLAGTDMAAEGDDQPEQQAGGSELARVLARETANAEHMAAMVRAITKAVDL